jgi:hypothetical protein
MLGLLGLGVRRVAMPYGLLVGRGGPAGEQAQRLLGLVLDPLSCVRTLWAAHSVQNSSLRDESSPTRSERCLTATGR